MRAFRLNEPGFAQTLREMTGGRGVGFAAGEIPKVKVNRLLLRNVGVIGVAFGALLELDRELMGQQARSLDGMVANGVVSPHIGRRFTFEGLPDALRLLARGQIHGKGVVVMPSERGEG